MFDKLLQVCNNIITPKERRNGGKKMLQITKEIRKDIKDLIAVRGTMNDDLELILEKLETKKKYIQKQLWEEYEIAKVNNLMGYDLGLEFAIEVIQEQLDNEK